MRECRAETPVDILLVEDNPGDVRLVKEAFDEERNAYVLHVVEDGDTALDFYYRRGEHVDAPRPDLVLLDLGLPRKSGEAVLEKLADDPDLRTIPVVVLSGSETREEIVRSYGLGANAYLTKPVDPDEFLESIRILERFWLSIARLPDTDT